MRIAIFLPFLAIIYEVNQITLFFCGIEYKIMGSNEKKIRFIIFTSPKMILPEKVKI